MTANLEAQVKQFLVVLGRPSRMATGLRFVRDGDQMAAVYFRDNFGANLVEFGFSTAAIATALGKPRQAVQEWIAAQATKYCADRTVKGERGKWPGFGVTTERDLKVVLADWQVFLTGQPATGIPALVRTRIRKLLIDSGFDLVPSDEDGWIRGASSAHNASVWVIAAEGASALTIALPSQDVLLQAMRINGVRQAVDLRLPPHAIGAVTVDGNESAQAVLSRVGELSALASDFLVREFHQKLMESDRSTEAERLVITRIGQDVFRDGLMRYWQGRCAVTNLAVPELLRASHIKAWRDCDTDSERLDVFNGVLLAPHLDALFDGGWITFDDAGRLITATTLPRTALDSLAVASDMQLRWITDFHRSYFGYHRQHYFEPRNKALDM